MKKLFATVLLFIAFLMTTPAAFAEMVMFNTKTYKFHTISCRYAHACTVNCIKIDRKEALRRGGIPCKVCGR